MTLYTVDFGEEEKSLLGVIHRWMIPKIKMHRVQHMCVCVYACVCGNGHLRALLVLLQNMYYTKYGVTIYIYTVSSCGVCTISQIFLSVCVEE